MMDLRELGDRIRSQRIKLGLKQQDIASALQVSPQSVSKWERGENGPDITTLPEIATLLGVSIDWLLGRFEEKTDVFPATVFASSVSGAWRKSSEVGPRDFAAWANGFFYQITEAALRFDAVPLKFMGDEFLCFFAGHNHQRRALDAATLARRMVEEEIKIGLAEGEIYLGAIGHPNYAQTDIMGKTVNLAFLVMRYADESTRSGIAATAGVLEGLEDPPPASRPKSVEFLGVDDPVDVVEVKVK